MAATCARLPGQGWHFQHGPMDLVLGAEGDPAAVAQAHEAAWQRFAPLLGELVAELALLRQPVDPGAACPLVGAVARSMWQACAPLVASADGFITPMAAVAGAVAQAVIACYQRPGITRAWVNNGGDIALHLGLGASVRVGLFADLARLDADLALASRAGRLPVDGRFSVGHADPVRGIATSGWRGRSFSLGIADSVTVLAATAAQADAAATVVANAVNLDHPAVLRRPACDLRDDSDLGPRLVTVGVPSLHPDCVQQALEQGLNAARVLQSLGLIASAALVCQGRLVTLPRLTPATTRAQALESVE